MASCHMGVGGTDLSYREWNYFLNPSIFCHELSPLRQNIPSSANSLHAEKDR